MVTSTNGTEKIMNAQDIANCWNQAMPNSRVSVGSFLGTLGFNFRISKDSSECANGIADNDPLLYKAVLKADGSFQEINLNMLVKPDNVYMVYGTVKMRKVTLKNATPEKVLKRFMAVRAWIMENAGNLKNPCFDINTK